MNTKRLICSLLVLTLTAGAAGCVDNHYYYDTSESGTDTIVMVDDGGAETTLLPDPDVGGDGDGDGDGDSGDGDGDTGSDDWCDFSPDNEARYWTAEDGDVCVRVETVWNGTTYDIEHFEMVTPETGKVVATDCEWVDIEDGKAWTGQVRCFWDGVDNRVIVWDQDAMAPGEQNDTNDLLDLAERNPDTSYTMVNSYWLTSFNG